MDITNETSNTQQLQQEAHSEPGKTVAGDAQQTIQFPFSFCGTQQTSSVPDEQVCNFRTASDTSDTQPGSDSSNTSDTQSTNGTSSGTTTNPFTSTPSACNGKSKAAPNKPKGHGTRQPTGRLAGASSANIIDETLSIFGLDSEISIFGEFRSTAQNTQSEPASSKQEPTSTQSFDAFNFGSTSSDAQEEPFMKQLSTSPRYFGGFKFGSTSSAIEKELDGNK
jgi:hypothetical protein